MSKVEFPDVATICGRRTSTRPYDLASVLSHCVAVGDVDPDTLPDELGLVEPVVVADADPVPLAVSEGDELPLTEAVSERDAVAEESGLVQRCRM